MKNLTQSILTAFVLLLLPMQATAADIKPYVGVGVGSYVVAPGTGWDTVFGGYGLIGVEVMPNLGLELRLGSTTGGSNPSGTFGTDGYISYLIRPQMQLGKKVNLYGLFGGSTIKSWYAPTGGTKMSKTQTKFSFGGGIEYMLYQDYFVGLEAFAIDPVDRPGVVPYNGNFIGAVSLTLRVY